MDKFLVRVSDKFEEKLEESELLLIPSPLLKMG